jgi:uncharacterized protein DUF3108
MWGLQQPAPVPTVTSAEPHIQPPPAGYHLPEGQSYVYEVEWRLWTAGMATLRIDDIGGEKRVHGVADSSGVVALLYHVHDTFDSFFNPRTFCSSRIQKHVEEGFRRVENSTTFDYARHVALLQQTNLRKGDRTQAEHPVPDCVTDVITAIYYVASLPLVPGGNYDFPVNDGGDTVTVTIHAEDHEQVKTPAGNFRTIRVQPQASKGVLKDRGKIWVWYTDDAARIPVQMRARMFWGTLTFRLARVEK